MAEASLWVFTRKINFIDNHTLTDRNVFYQDANGDPQNPLVGWGIDPLVEFDTTTSYPQPERIALGMYWASNWVYEGSTSQWYIDPSLFADTTAFRLRNALTSQSEYPIECRDVSGFVFLANQGQGIPGYLTRLTAQSVSLFGTNQLSPMGNDATVDEHPWTGDNTYRYYNFNFHQVPILLGGVYDAAAAHRVDLSGVLYRNAPTGWSLGGYWQTPNSTYDFVGLVRGLANSTPESAGTAEALSASTDTKSIDGYEYD